MALYSHAYCFTETFECFGQFTVLKARRGIVAMQGCRPPSPVLRASPALSTFPRFLGRGSADRSTRSPKGPTNNRSPRPKGETRSVAVRSPAPNRSARARHSRTSPQSSPATPSRRAKPESPRTPLPAAPAKPTARSCHTLPCKTTSNTPRHTAPSPPPDACSDSRPA